MKIAYVRWLILAGVLPISAGHAQESGPGPAVQRWLVEQRWERDTAGPVVELGAPGAFDDTHLFAPCVAREDGRFRLWYCGSTGRVAERVFSLGLVSSADGRRFQPEGTQPVYAFGDGRHSVLTPTLLRRADGSLLREEGRLRMWFSATDFAAPSGLHTLHEAFSGNGRDWTTPSPALLEHVYAPTVLRDEDRYRLWYTDVAGDPWVLRYAESDDGRQWRVHPHPVLVRDQAWEQGRLFYPAVVKADGVFLMWYGSYWSAERNKTALGFAVSQDGIHWIKHPKNPVFRPDPQRDWESHYTTSQSVLRLADGSWRIWYASRRAPPFVNKYFAIGTARWSGPDRITQR